MLTRLTRDGRGRVCFSLYFLFISFEVFQPRQPIKVFFFTLLNLFPFPVCFFPPLASAGEGVRPEERGGRHDGDGGGEAAHEGTRREKRQTRPFFSSPLSLLRRRSV